MRDIRFRAWNKSKMYGWEEIGGNGGLNKLVESLHFLPDMRIMQYTGLKDKNGKDIYEGDIVKDWENIDLYEVVWNRRYACFELNRLTFGNDTGQEIDNSHLDLEIIGNIYENKDLLEAKEI